MHGYGIYSVVSIYLGSLMKMSFKTTITMSFSYAQWFIAVRPCVSPFDLHSLQIKGGNKGGIGV